MVHTIFLPPHIIITKLTRCQKSQYTSEYQHDCSSVFNILHVSRLIRQEALPLVFSRLRYSIHLSRGDGYRTIDRTFRWLQTLTLPNNDALRNVTINYHDYSPRFLEHLFDSVARLPRVFLRFNASLHMLAFADGDGCMALKNMHGFSHASFEDWNGGFAFCDKHRQRPLDGRQVWEDLDQRFRRAVAKLMSPCPGNSCKVHPWPPPQQATSRVKIGWSLRPGDIQASCFYDYCMSGTLLWQDVPWAPGPKSIFTLDKPGTENKQD